MNIVVFVSDYPSKKRNNFVFVKQLVDQFGLLGHHCYVISPNPVIRNKGFEKAWAVKTFDGKGSVTIVRPNYLTIPFLRIGSFYPSEWLKNKAIKRAVRKLGIVPDVVYCHFWNQGLLAYKYTREWNKPLIVASGESNIADLTKLNEVTPEFVEAVNGVVCVSTKCMDESIKLGLTTHQKCTVIPNAIDQDKFHVLDKKKCREMIGIPSDKFVACFVGWFIERKGPLRVMAAIEKLGNENIGVIFAGSGSQKPEGVNILFKGSVEHSQLKFYLNAADVFVLPTLNEGCCNAVIEAMACGLPIISSDLPFNKDVLNKDNSILINPNNIDDIAKAINTLFVNKELRERLSEGALKTAKELTIGKRAERIINFIESKNRI